MRSNFLLRTVVCAFAGLTLVIFTMPSAQADSNKSSPPALATTAPTTAPVGPLGDLSAFRTIAQDTLRIAKTGDLAAAKTRITDLETAWDEAEEKLKAKDKQKWTSIDKSIDRALKELRSSPPVAADCVNALEKLIAKFDSISPR